MTLSEQTNPTIPQRLIYALHEMHRPELANLIRHGAVTLSGRVLLLEPAAQWWAATSAADTLGFYEEIFTLAAMRVGLPIESTRIWRTRW
jgi:hypothetical protein